ncbi:hypothetical protein Bca52824_007445 [Brassica carinata]|uniref:Replication protein A 70 kDa DNA-binding subunit B/D first OB fold domain-containing protein n=1 Tax=Brassica carinata TaxID=52824 RepID=A0A8X8B872_BRACI|nr:hypothetical protein Bca52824_007445 [Brassica carinata]
MSAARKMVLINDLKPFKDEWQICVKLLHSWKSKTDYGGEAFECIFVDKTGQKIHASCKRSLMFRVQRDTQKGEWREVENFKISGAGGQYRPSKFQYKMTIIGDTVIRPTDYRNDNHFLSLASYKDISSGVCKPFFLIDVMGQVVDLGGVAVCQLQSGENRKRVQFRLRDTTMLQDDLPLALLGKSDEKKVIKKEAVDNWNDVDIRSISEICLAVEISRDISNRDNGKRRLQQRPLSGNHAIEQRKVQQSVPLCSVFKRIFEGLGLSNSKDITVREGLTTSTPKTPTMRPICVLGNVITNTWSQNSPNQLLYPNKSRPVLCDITNVHQTHLGDHDNAKEGLCHQRKKKQNVPTKRKKRQNKTKVQDVITNIDFTLENEIENNFENNSTTEEPQLNDDHIEDDQEEMNDCDVDIEGIIEEIDADLEFDVSSQESTDSENDDVGLDESNSKITYQCRKEVNVKRKPRSKSSISKSRGVRRWTIMSRRVV